MQISVDEKYKSWFEQVKNTISSVQAKASFQLNKQLILLYWELGRMITEIQENSVWGDKVIDQLSNDLKRAFPNMKGFSNRNLKYTHAFYKFYTTEIGQQAVAQLENLPFFNIPWSHNILIFTKSESLHEALFYINVTIENQK